MDRRGDSSNAKYGGNHSYTVPEYRRVGGGRVMGLPDNLRIDRSVTKSGTITLVDKSKKVKNKIKKRYVLMFYIIETKQIHRFRLCLERIGQDIKKVKKRGIFFL